MTKTLAFLVLVVSCCSAYASEVALPYKRNFKPLDYLEYMVRKIPIDQAPFDGESLRLSGLIDIRTNSLPSEIAAEVKFMWTTVLEGKIRVMGLTVDASKATVIFDRPVAEAPPQPVALEPVRPTGVQFDPNRSMSGYLDQVCPGMLIGR